jgi:glycosyltransferase involved in cell wall biosynthesis
VEEKLIVNKPVPHNEVPRYLNCMDTLVLPSITTPTWKEQFDRVLIEAMACEIPVVGSDSGQIPYIIEDAGGGWVFHEGDAEDLKNKLATLFFSKKLHRKLGTTGRRNIREKYACSKVAEQLYQVFKKVLDEHGD